MSGPDHIPQGGFSLIEALIVVAIVAIAGIAAGVSLCDGLRRQEARGAAQVCQAASAWSQVGVLWNGGSSGMRYAAGEVSVRHSAAMSGAELGPVAPRNPVDPNVRRWARDGGVVLTFSGWSASPDSGGSLFFSAPGGSYRVVIRPGSGLTVRSWVGGE